jgi:hypothetical protein
MWPCVHIATSLHKTRAFSGYRMAEYSYDPYQTWNRMFPFIKMFLFKL